MSDTTKTLDEATRTQMADAYGSGDFEALQALATKVLEDYPDNLDAIRYLARVYTNRHEPDHSQIYWRRLVELTPDQPEPYLQLARIERNEKDWESALEHSREFLDRQPDNQEIRTIEVQALLQLGRGEEIGPSVEKLVDMDPSVAMPLIRKAFGHDAGLAVAPTLRKLVDAGDEEAVAFCEQQIEAERKEATRHEIQRNPFRAAACYLRMRELDPSNGFGSSALLRLRKPFLERAREAFAEGDDKRAISHARNSLRIEPHEEEPYLIIGRSAMRNDDVEMAYSVLREAMENNEHTLWLTVNFARAAEKSGRWGEAFEAYSAVLASDDEEAAKHAEEAQRSVDRLPARMAKDAIDLLQDGDVSGAVTLAKKLIDAGRIDEKTTKHLTDNIVTHGQRRLRELYDANDREAIGVGRSLIAFAPDKFYAYRVVGRMLLRDRNYGEAAEIWSQLVERDGNEVEFRLNYARSLQRMGDKKGAAEAAQELLRLEPEHEEGRTILDSVKAA